MAQMRLIAMKTRLRASVAVACGAQVDYNRNA
jgi:hypothetical protein